MLLRHFQALIGHGEGRDKPVLSTAIPEGFGTGGQVEQQQEQLPLHGGQTPRQGQPRIVFPSRGSCGGSGGSPTPPAALSSAHAPLPSTTFGFSPAMTSPSHSRGSSSTFVTGSGEMSLQAREQVRPMQSPGRGWAPGLPHSPGQHHSPSELPPETSV